MKVRVETCKVKIIVGEHLVAFPLTLALSPQRGEGIRRGEEREEEKGKRIKSKGLADVLGKTKTHEVEPVVSGEPVPVRRAKVHRIVVAPGTAPNHTPAAVTTPAI